MRVLKLKTEWGSGREIMVVYLYNPSRKRSICNLGESREHARCSVLVASLRRILCINIFFMFIFIRNYLLLLSFYFLYTHLIGLHFLLNLSRETARYKCNNVDLAVKSSI